MKTFAKVLSMVLMLALLVVGFASCAKPQIEVPEFSEDTIKIGLSGPLTGGAAVYGTAVYNSAKLAVYEINQAGGLNGVKFSLEAYDDEHNASKVAQGYATLAEDGMQVSLGCVTTNPCLEFLKYAVEDGMFFITPSASAYDVPATSEGFGYQMCFADPTQGTAAAQYVNGLGLTKVGMFFKSDDAYSTGIRETFLAELNDSIEVVEQSFTEQTQTDFATQVNALKDCEFIFMPIYYGPASTFMTQAVGVVADNATYYGCDGFDGMTAEFDVTTVPQKIQMLSHYDSNATSGAAKDFADKYVENFGADTLNQFGAAAYDCVYAIYNALKDSGETVNGSTTVAEMTAILKAAFDGDFTYTGVTGNNMTWENGYVNKTTTPVVIKNAD